MKKTPQRRRLPAEWAVTFLTLLFGYTTVGWTYVVPTGSMDPTLMVGDHVLVDHLVYSPPGPLSRYVLPYADVERGDIIVFKYPLAPKSTYVKRVIGVPGDRVRIRDKVVYVNGVELAEPYKRVIAGQRSDYLNNFPSGVPDVLIDARAAAMLRDFVRDGELRVPPGHYFAMGDNRDNSADSRFWGFVPRESIVGKPVLVFWSYDATTEQLAGRSYWIDVAQHLFTRTRWSRTLRPARLL